MLTQEKKQEVLELCARLIQAESYSGNEKAVGGILADYFKAHGFDEVTVDGYGDVIGCVRGNRPGPRVLFDGHMARIMKGADLWNL